MFTKHRISRLPIAIFLFNILACLPPMAANAGPSALEQEVINLVNGERSNAGLPALVYEERLAIAARCHAIDMATDNYFDHNSNDGVLPDNSDGTPPDKRIERAGYVWGAWGENIAAVQTSPQAVMDAWMISPPHKANILDPNYTEIGIGHGYNDKSTHGHYWVQDFGAPWVNPHNPVNNYCRTSNPANIIPSTMLLLN